MLPLGMTLEDLKNGVSSIRNKTISRIFAELGWIEQWGSGYKRIIESCEKDGYPIPKWEEFGSAIRITFYPHPATKGLSADLALSRHQASTKSLNNEEQELLKFCKSTRSLQEMMSLMDWKDRTKFRKKYINVLIKNGLLKMTIPDKPQSSKQKYIAVTK